MLKKENFFSSKDYFFFCIVDIFHDNNCINNSKFIGSNFLKNVILDDVLCINKSIYSSSIFVYSKLYLDHLKLDFFSNFLLLKGKNIYYIFIFDEYLFFKFFISLISYNNNIFKINLVSKYGMYIQPMYFYMYNGLYVYYFNNFSNLVLYSKVFLFFEKYLYKNRINSDILYGVGSENRSDKCYLFALYDILLCYVSEYASIVHLLI